jgi:hypothetical protein
MIPRKRKKILFCNGCKRTQKFVGVESDPEGLLRCPLCGLVVKEGDRCLRYRGVSGSTEHE